MCNNASTIEFQSTTLGWVLRVCMCVFTTLITQVFHTTVEDTDEWVQGSVFSRLILKSKSSKMSIAKLHNIYKEV